MASAENQTVRLPRRRRLASYSAQFVTRYRCLGIRCRRVALALNGTAEIRQEGAGLLCDPVPVTNSPIRATKRRGGGRRRPTVVLSLASHHAVNRERVLAWVQYRRCE